MLFQPTRPQPAVAAPECIDASLNQPARVSTHSTAASGRDPNLSPAAAVVGVEVSTRATAARIAASRSEPRQDRGTAVSTLATAASGRDSSGVSRSSVFQPSRPQPALATIVRTRKSTRSTSFQPSRPQPAIRDDRDVRLAELGGLVSTLATAVSDRDLRFLAIARQAFGDHHGP